MDDWVWRSLVACLNGVQEAGGSNPLTQTIFPTGFYYKAGRDFFVPMMLKGYVEEGHAICGHDLYVWTYLLNCVFNDYKTPCLNDQFVEQALSNYVFALDKAALSRYN